jgi:3D-(3,5/4)-trihydroxycyclohexane-1,2-dione acylhydrolase (decyclizing)
MSDTITPPTILLTAAQATVRWLAAQQVVVDGARVPYFAGAWAIFGHGNVAGLGEALHAAGDALPTWRAHNEQAMAHAAIAYAKQMRRRRAMVCTSSIGPGATNMVTAAALAHVNRLPVLLLPGDVYAGRRPDPVLQQLESGADGTASVNDCFRPVSRYFDRITRPEQILDALPRALAVLRDPALCGPATLAFCQDVQAEAFGYPESFFEPVLWPQRRQPADAEELQALLDAVRLSRRPLLVCGGGVAYSGAEAALSALATATGLAVAETQAGKGTLPWDHPRNLGAIGVTGSTAANAAAQAADLVVGVGTRLQDFTTGSRSLFPQARLFQVNVQPLDAHKHGAAAVVGDALLVLEALREGLGDWRVDDEITQRDAAAIAAWNGEVDAAIAAGADDVLPSDAQVLGAVQAAVADDAIVVCAAGGLPGELHKLWRTASPRGYHVEYGYSCMGYEIAGGLGVKMAEPQREVVVLVGDGSYLMMNSELATSVMLGLKLLVVVLDNRGFGCIDRLQRATGGAGFNNLLDDARHARPAQVDFAAHARSLGALAEHVAGVAQLGEALARARAADRSSVVVIDTDPRRTTEAGGWWWDVAVPEVSDRTEVNIARQAYEAGVPLKRNLP